MLREIAGILRTDVISNGDRPVKGVSIDSRKVEKGMLFFALPGDQFDGHQFIDKAIEKGACGAVVSREWFSEQRGDSKKKLLPVIDPMLALQELAARYRKKFHFPVIAVTGTNGKTTTKEMIAKVLGKKVQIMKSSGNFNNHIGVPLSICSWQKKGEAAVIEMGANHFGEINRLCQIAQPTHGVVTNIGKGHIEFFNDVAGVAKAKGELIEFLAESGEAFINGDDSHLLLLQKVVKKTTTYGFSERCHLRAKDLGVDRFGFPKMCVEGETIKISVPGRYNLYNGLGAAAIGRSFSISWEDIKEALESYRSIEKRMEVRMLSGVCLLNDAYNANPSSIPQVLMTLKSMKNFRRKIVVFGDMLELGKHSEKEHQIVGERVKESGVDALFSFGVMMKIAANRAKKLGLSEVHHFDSKPALIDALKSYIKEGDVVLIKGSRGMVMEEIVNGLEKENGFTKETGG